MHWRKRDLWKAGIIVAGVLLFFVILIWTPVSSAGTHQGVSEPATLGTVTVQATPTEDATVTALNKEKLAEEVQQLKQQNTSDLFGWLRTNAAILLSTLVVVIGGLIGLWRWFGDRRSERGKRDEERFQIAIERLGNANQAMQVGAAITLRTFLDAGYQRFYSQIFDLAVAYLRLRKVDPVTAEPLDSLSQALITIFKESFLKVRPRLRWIDGTWPENAMNAEQQLNAAYVQLDTAYFAHADLRYVWMLQAYLREADLVKADLRHATLRRADMRKANLIGANLFNADLRGASLEGASLEGASLIGANLSGANLSGANLSGANLGAAHLRQANLSYANLSYANLRPEATYNESPLSFMETTSHVTIGHLSDTDFTNANLLEADLRGADLRGVCNLEEALSLKGTDLRKVEGLTKEQLATCKAKGAIIDEDPTNTQATVTPPLPPGPRNDTQALSAPSAQASTPTSDAGGSNPVSSQPDSES